MSRKSLNWGANRHSEPSAKNLVAAIFGCDESSSRIAEITRPKMPREILPHGFALLAGSG
jgi:hypothetical protein